VGERHDRPGDRQRPHGRQRQAQLLLHGLATAGAGWPADAALAPLGLDAVASAALHPADGSADDITADAISQALGIPLYEDPRIIAAMLERLKPEDLNEARRRMARIPVGAEHVVNPISKVPGFKIENVIVMAGVPSIMQAMMDDVAPRLTTGARMMMETVEATGIPEGTYATALSEIAKAHPDTIIGSYPQFHEGRFRNQIVVRSKDGAALQAALEAVDAMLKTMTPRER
jgi:molybdopterin-biosynthesis enzyme MoeA-like protein